MKFLKFKRVDGKEIILNTAHISHILPDSTDNEVSVFWMATDNNTSAYAVRRSISEIARALAVDKELVDLNFNYNDY
jgi:uncharacterized protein YlzI (FlbEa/FlbD family)